MWGAIYRPHVKPLGSPVAYDDTMVLSYTLTGVDAEGTLKTNGAITSGDSTVALEKLPVSGNDPLSVTNLTPQMLLSGLTVSEGTLSPAFDPRTFSYRVLVASDVESVEVTPRATGAAVSMTVGNTATASPMLLKVGLNTIDILLTDDGNPSNTTTYTLEITRAGLTGLLLSQGTISPTFDGTMQSYAATVANNVESVTVLPVWDWTGTQVRVNNGSTITISGTASQPIALNIGENRIPVSVQQGGLLTSYTLIVTRDAAPTPTDEMETLAGLLSDLNTALYPEASVTGLSETPVGTPITKALPADATFTKKDKPTSPFPGFVTLAPSFTSTVNLGGETAGDTLALKYTIELISIEGFENWGSLSTGGRVALLDALKNIFAYEYADGTWKVLAGPDGIVSWTDAFDAGIVTFTSTAISINYAVTDGTGDPTASGKFMVIPDGAADNKIVDPMWLLYAEKVVPVSITLDPPSMSMKKNESKTVTVKFTPSDATERGIVWTESNPGVASVTRTATPNTWTVKGPKAGTTVLTALVSADRTVFASLSVTVAPESDLIASIGVSPLPPYRKGDMIQVTAKLTRTPSSVTAAIRRPDGTMDTPAVQIDNLDAWLTYELADPGLYTITVTATDGTGGSWSKAAGVTVTSGGAIVVDDDSGGGCNAAGPGLLALALGVVLLKRR